MKSRVINTKYFQLKNKMFVAKVSELKPSLFYGNVFMEAYIWLQSQKTNKMSKWILDETISTDKYWVYKCVSLKKYPILQDYSLKIIWDKPKNIKMINHHNKFQSNSLHGKKIASKINKKTNGKFQHYMPKKEG